LNHGGINYGRTVRGPFITIKYDYDALIDEYGKKIEPVMAITFKKTYCKFLL
jgi:hypothetical protein